MVVRIVNPEFSSSYRKTIVIGLIMSSSPPVTSARVLFTLKINNGKNRKGGDSFQKVLACYTISHSEGTLCSVARQPYFSSDQSN